MIKTDPYGSVFRHYGGKAMDYKTIDLYEYFSLPRGVNGGGYLTVYARSSITENTPKIRPAVLVIPGGGYGMISEREGEPVSLRFLAEGYAVFQLQYTVNAAYPVPLAEAAMAMAYIRKESGTYGLDGHHVCVVGFSAGGHLAAMLATLYDAPELPACVEGLVRPDAAILSYAVLTTERGKTHEGTAEVISGGDDALRARLSLETRVSGLSSPAFIWHTGNDDVVPVIGALRYAEACLAAGVDVELHVFERGPHGLSVADIETSDNLEGAEANRSIRAWLPLAFRWLECRGFTVLPA